MTSTEVTGDAAAGSEATIAAVESNSDAIAAALRIQQKYAEEREKRLQKRPEAYGQYVEADSAESLKHFAEDPWVEMEGPSAYQLNIPADSKTKVVILGAGFGGLLFAVRMIERGIDPDDIRLVDTAGGFGGTWYWNRYPGLMCDVESYMYLPLLEETGYVPKHRFSYGSEIREYINSIVDRYGLRDKAFFQTQVTSMTWDDAAKEWTVEMVQKPKGQEHNPFSLRTQFVSIAAGVLHHPKIPHLPGVGSYKGHTFHTSRFDYGYTGGSQAEPDLVNLKGKTVGIIGTGATAIQLVPQLAKWAKHLYVFQRTPSAVDVRDQRETDIEWFKKTVAAKKGWQTDRNINWLSFLSGPGPKPDVNLVDDAWSHFPSYGALQGSTYPVTRENVADYVRILHEMDIPRSERVRSRVDTIVKDKNTAEKLKAWYPGWCKRPTFHDDYLETFNKPNVTLVDTDGRGVDDLTGDSAVVGGNKYQVDCLVFGTGYRSPALGGTSAKANITVTGRNGLVLEDKYMSPNWGTLHGTISHDFPNLFLAGLSQSAASANFSFTLDVIAKHTAETIRQAIQRHGEGSKVVIEPTQEAEDAWGMEIAVRAVYYAAVPGCTPSYLNIEGATDKLTPEQQMAGAKKGGYATGMPSYLKVLEEWEENGKLEGLEISVA